MPKQWRVRVTGARRENIAVDQMVRAVMALGRQMRDAAQQGAQSETAPEAVEGNQTNTEGE